MQEQDKEKFSLPQLPTEQEVNSPVQESIADSSAQTTQRAEVPVLTEIALRQPAQPAEQQAPAAKKRSKKWLLILALVFLLFATILIVPANRLPGMNGLMGMLGVSVNGTNSVSLGRALWGWVTGGEFSFSRAGAGTRVADSESVRSVFDNNLAPGFSANGPQSGLFDLAAVNADRRARGLGEEGLFGAYYGSMTEEERRAALARLPEGWSAEEQAEQAKKNTNEVYFGADESLLARAAAENAGVRGSSDTAKMLAKLGIVGAVQPDWLASLIAKAAKLTDGDMNKGLDKVFETSTALSALNGQLTHGTVPERDLARVWLLSKASNKAQQLMLKKQLAAAGYIAMEIPKKVYDSFGESSGLTLTGDEILVSFEEMDQHLFDDETCRDFTKASSSQIDNKLVESRNNIRMVATSIPQDCETSSMTTWVENIEKVHNNCGEVKEIFSDLKRGCGVKTKAGSGHCESLTLTTYREDLEGACGQLADAEEALAVAQDLLALAEQERDQLKDIDLPTYKDEKKVKEDEQKALDPEDPEYQEKYDALQAEINALSGDIEKTENKIEELQGKDGKGGTIKERQDDVATRTNERNDAEQKQQDVVNNMSPDQVYAAFNVAVDNHAAGSNEYFPEADEEQDIKDHDFYY